MNFKYHPMKIKLLALILSFAVVSGCKQGNSLEAKKQQLDKLKKEQEALSFKIDELQKEILKSDSSALTEKKKGKLVTTFVTEKKLFRNYIEIQGNAESDLNITVSPEMGGEVVSVLVEDGQSVKKGQLLVQLDDDLLQKQLDDMKVSLDLATTVFNKQQNLWNKKIGSELQYLQAKNNKESLEAKTKTLQTQLSKTRITAPVDGTVERVMIKEGETAAPGHPMMNVVNLDKITVKADVPERFVGVVKKGDEVAINFTSLNIERKATVSSVGSLINPANRTFRVEVEIPNKDHSLKANMLALLKIVEYQNENAITVPTRIVQQDREENFIYIVSRSSEPAAQKKIIQVGKSYGGETEVLSGLSEKEEVIDAGFQYVTEGALVEIQN